MAEQFGNYLVSNSNGSRNQQPCVTVRRIDGAIVARVHSPHSQPLRHLRNWIDSEERAELIMKLQQAGVDEITINKILRKG